MSTHGVENHATWGRRTSEQSGFLRMFEESPLQRIVPGQTAAIQVVLEFIKRKDKKPELAELNYRHWVTFICFQWCVAGLPDRTFLFPAIQVDPRSSDWSDARRRLQRFILSLGMFGTLSRRGGTIHFCPPRGLSHVFFEKGGQRLCRTLKTILSSKPSSAPFGRYPRRYPQLRLVVDLVAGRRKGSKMAVPCGKADHFPRSGKVARGRVFERFCRRTTIPTWRRLLGVNKHGFHLSASLS